MLSILLFSVLLLCILLYFNAYEELKHKSYLGFALIARLRYLERHPFAKVLCQFLHVGKFEFLCHCKLVDWVSLGVLRSFFAYKRIKPDTSWVAFTTEPFAVFFSSHIKCFRVRLVLLRIKVHCFFLNCKQYFYYSF